MRRYLGPAVLVVIGLALLAVAWVVGSSNAWASFGVAGFFFVIAGLLFAEATRKT